MTWKDVEDFRQRKGLSVAELHSTIMLCFSPDGYQYYLPLQKLEVRLRLFGHFEAYGWMKMVLHHIDRNRLTPQSKVVAPPTPTPDEIRAWRKRNGLSVTKWQLELQRIAVQAMSYITVINWESGRYRPPPWLWLAMRTYEEGRRP